MGMQRKGSQVLFDIDSNFIGIIENQFNYLYKYRGDLYILYAPHVKRFSLCLFQFN